MVAGHAEGPQSPLYRTTVTVGAASPGAPPGSDPEVVPSTKGMKSDKRVDRWSYSSSPPHSFSRAFLYSPEVSSCEGRWRQRTVQQAE